MSKKKTIKGMRELLRVDLREKYRYTLFSGWEGRDLSATVISAISEGDALILSIRGDPVIQSYDGGENWGFYDGPRQWPKCSMMIEYGDFVCSFDGGNKFQRSLDGGRTWTLARNIPSAKDVHFERLSVALCFCGILTRTRARRIVLANSYWTGQEGPDGELLSCTVSEDWGESWEVGRLFGPAAPLPSGPEGFGEPAIVEMPNGWLWMVFRTAYGELWQCISQDGGLTWNAPTPTGFASPIANCYAKRDPYSGATVLAWNLSKPGVSVGSRDHHSLYRPRNNLVFSVSHDNTRTWTVPITVEEGFGQYPKIYFTEDRMFILYQKSTEELTPWRDMGLELVAYDRQTVISQPPWDMQTIQPYIDAGLVRHWRALAVKPKPTATVD